MDIFRVYLFVMFNCVVYGRTFNRCHNYRSINKENIRNCLPGRADMNHTNVSSSNITTNQGEHNIFIEDGNGIGHKNMPVDEQHKKNFYAYIFKLLLYSMGGHVDDANGTISISFKLKVQDMDGRKMKSTMNNLMQYALVPGFLMAGILPWVMPKIQLVVMIVSMMNNMAFTSALFSLVRSFVFEHEPDEHIIYVNNGYKNNY